MNKQGFTLIELLVALGVFAIVAVPLFQTEVLAGRMVMSLQERREGLALASVQLDAAQHATTVGQDTTMVDGYQVITSSGHVEGLPVPLTRIAVEVRHEGHTVATLSAYRM